MKPPATKQHPVTQYATDVVYGRYVVCKWEKLACERHLADLKRQGTKAFPFVFDETRADRIIRWFEYCRHVRGPFAGKPIQLDPWQQFDLGCVFGWVHADTGKRRFKTAYIRVARGNAKSTVMSGIANYGMCGDALYPPGKPELAKYEAAPEVVCAAVDRKQAAIVWGDAWQMATSSPEIAKRLNLQKTKVSHKSRGGELSKLSRDTKNKDGGAPCIIIIDEYHAHPTSLVKDVTASGKGKRSQCLEFIITTAGEDAENKPCFIEDRTVKKILAGEIIDETYFAVVREIDDEDDPHDKRTWVKANPIIQSGNEYGRTLHDQIESEYQLAFGSADNSKIRQWMIKRVDRWQAESEQKYMAGCMKIWKSLGVSRDKFLELTKGQRGHVGIDLSKRIDLTADGWVFRLPDGVYAVCAHGYMPEDTATAHEKGDRIPYKDWARDGWVTLTPGAVTDDRYVKQGIHDAEMSNDWSVDEVCYDPYGARQLANVLDTDGYTTVETRQGVATLSEPTKKFRELILQQKIVHDGSPLLTWCLSNAFEVSDNNGNIKLNKKHKDDTQRIDAIAAIINAMHRAIVPGEQSIFESVEFDSIDSVDSGVNTIDTPNTIEERSVPQGSGKNNRTTYRLPEQLPVDYSAAMSVSGVREDSDFLHSRFEFGLSDCEDEHGMPVECGHYSRGYE